MTTSPTPVDPQRMEARGAAPAAPAASHAGWWGRRRARSEVALVAAVVAVLAVAALAFRGLARFASMRETVESGVTGVERLFFVPADSSPELIFPAFVWMLWNRRRRLRAALPTPGTAWIGIPALLLGGAVSAWSYYVDQPPLLLVGLAGMLLAGGWLLGGAAAVRTLAVPALFLQLAWPLPGVLVNHLVYPLQLAGGDLATRLLSLIGMTWERSGDLIAANGRLFQVIETCSGLRAMTTMTMSAFLYAELFHRSERRLLWLLVLAPLIAFLLNGVRILTIILNPYSEIAAVHTTQGLVTIVAGVLALAGCDVLLDCIPGLREGRDASRRIRRVPPGEAPVVAWRWAAVALALAALALAPLVEPWRPSTEVRIRLLTRVPTQLAGFTGANVSLDKQFLGSLRYSDHLSRVYRRDGEQVNVLVLEDNRIRPLLSVDSPKTAVGESGWQILERRAATLLDGRPAEWLRLRSLKGEQQLVLHWQEGIHALPIELMRSVFSLDASPFRHGELARAVRLATPLSPRAGTEEEAQRRLLDFAAELAPLLVRDRG